LTVDRVRVVVDLWALLRGRAEVRSVVVSGPRLRVEDSPDFRERLQRLTARLQRLSRGAATARFPFTIEDAALSYRGEPLAAKVDIERLQMTLRWLATDRARLAIRSDAVSVALAGREIREVGIEGELVVASDLVEVARLRVAQGMSSLSFGGVLWSGDPSPTEVTATGALDLAHTASLLGVSGSWKGMLAVQGSLSGERFSREFKGTLAVTEGTLRGLPVSQAKVLVSLTRELLEVVSFSAHADGGSLSGSGSYEPILGRYRLTTQLDHVSLRTLLQLAGRSEKLSGRLTGRVEGRGRGKSVAEFVGQGEVSVNALRLEGNDQSAEVAVRGTVRNGRLFADRFSVRSGGGSLSGRGSVQLATGAIDLTLQASVARLEHDLWPRGIAGLGGRLTASGRVSRRLLDPLFVGQLKGQDLRVGAARLDTVEGSVEASQQRVASRSLRVGIGRTVATMSGEARIPDLELWPGGWRDNLALTVKVDLRGRAEDLGSLLPSSWPPVGGPLSLQLSAKGSPLALSGSGQMEMREVRVGADRWDLLRAVLAFKGKDLTVPTLTLRRRGVTIQAEGRIDLAGRYSVVVAPVALDLATLPGLGERGGKGTAILKARGAGDLSRPELQGEISLSNSVFRGLSLGNGDGTFRLDRGHWQWSLRLASGYEAHGVLPLGLAGPFRAQVAALNADLSPFLSGLQLRFPFTARADGSATFTGELPNLSGLTGEIELTSVRGQARDTPWQSRGGVGLKLESGAIRISSLDLVGPGLSVALRGVIKPGELSEIELAGYAPFPIVEPWVPPVEAVRGRPEVRVTLAGRPGVLAVTGSADLRTVDVKLKEFPVWLSVGRGEVTFTNDRVQFRLVEGAAAGGRLEGQGEARRREGRWAHTVEFNLDRAELAQLYDQWKARARWASGTLSLKGSMTFETGGGLSPLASLGGKVAMSVDGGSISRYPALIRIFGLLTSPAQPTRLPDLTREQMPYRRISGDFVATDGLLESKNLVLDSEVARMSGVGKVSLSDRTLDLNVAVRPLQVLEQGIRRIPLLGRVLPQEQSLGVVYFDVEGPWADPQVTVAPIKTLGQSVVEILLLLLRAPDRLLIPQSEGR
jgi:uncharacterized protein involved in outer membrane biogenesis